jgi:hypothetical protein
MFGRTSSSNLLVSISLCGVYSRGYSFLIFLKNSSHRGNVVLAPMFGFVSLKAEGWIKASLEVVLMTCIGFGVNSNCLTTAGEDPSPTSGSCGSGTLGDFLVEGFFGGIVPTIKITFKHVYKEVLGCELIKGNIKCHKWIHTCNAC